MFLVTKKYKQPYINFDVLKDLFYYFIKYLIWESFYTLLK
jgi:hypothetical protein